MCFGGHELARAKLLGPANCNVCAYSTDPWHTCGGVLANSLYAFTPLAAADTERLVASPRPSLPMSTQVAMHAKGAVVAQPLVELAGASRKMLAASAVVLYPTETDGDIIYFGFPSGTTSIAASFIDASQLSGYGHVHSPSVTLFLRVSLSNGSVVTLWSAYTTGEVNMPPLPGTFSLGTGGQRITALYLDSNPYQSYSFHIYGSVSVFPPSSINLITSASDDDVIYFDFPSGEASILVSFVDASQLKGYGHAHGGSVALSLRVSLYNGSIVTLWSSTTTGQVNMPPSPAVFSLGSGGQYITSLYLDSSPYQGQSFHDITGYVFVSPGTAAPPPSPPLPPPPPPLPRPPPPGAAPLPAALAAANRLWLDAACPSSLVFSASGGTAVWRDISGLGFDAAAYGSGLTHDAGAYGVTFVTGSYFATAASTVLPAGAPAYTLVAAWQWGTSTFGVPNDNQVTLFGQGPSGLAAGSRAALVVTNSASGPGMQLLSALRS